MSIKQEADSIHFSHYPNERVYANALGEAFDITSAGRSKQFSYWIADPKEHVRQRFGLLQEVLVIYSDHLTVDARVLSAIDELSGMRDLRLRIDRFIYLLICSGADTFTGDLVRTSIDRVVIPITAKELIDPQRGNFFVRGKIADAVGVIDLFEMSSPIRADKNFFGREDLVQLLTARCLSKRENSGLFGLRKTGKTSVLFALERRVRDSSVITEYVDCQNPGIHAMRWWQLLAEISERIFRKTSLSFSDSSFSEHHVVEAAAAKAFDRDIKFIIEKTGCQIILMLDEIEYITHGLSGALGKHWDSDFHLFWATIRAVQQETLGAITFIVAGVNPSCVEISHFGTVSNPIFQLAVPQYLEPLKKEGVRDMVRKLGRYGGLDFHEDVYDYLRKTYGGHPYLVRLACSEVWKAFHNTNPDRNVPVKISSFESSRPSIRQRLARPIRDILLSLVWWYPEEYDLLQILASGNSSDEKFVREYLHGKPEQITQFARYGILNDDNSSFAIDDLRSFLVNNGLEYKNEVSPFSRTDMPQQVVSDAPDLVLLSKLFNEKVEIERDLRRIVLVVIGSSVLFDQTRLAKALIEGIKPRSDRKKPEDLFLGREPREVIADLYMLDLKGIILAHWDKFKPMFRDKSRFEMNMDGINIARRADAHTASISAEEQKDFQNSYHWMRQCLRPVIDNLPHE